MSGDAVGELKIKVGVDLDVAKVEQQQQQAAAESVAIWDDAANQIQQRLSDPSATQAALDARSSAVQAEADTEIAAVEEVEEAHEAAIDAANERTKSLAEGLQTFGKWASIALGGAAALFLNATRDTALAVDRQSRSLGLSREQVQQWQYVAGQAGVEADAFGQAIGGLAQRANDAAQNGGGAAARFRELGIELTDASGNLRPTNDLLLDAADALHGMAPGAHQTATAMALFGDQGRQLLPVLSQGREGVAALTGEFDALGGGLDNGTIDAVVASDREFKRLRVELTSMLMPAVRFLLDGAGKVTRIFHAVTRDTGSVKVALGLMAAGLAVLARRFIVLKAEAIATWAATFGPLLLGAALVGLLYLVVDDLIALFSGGDSVIGEFIDALFGVGTAKAWVEDLKKTWDELGESIDYAIEKVKEYVGYDSEVADGGDAAAQRVRVENAAVAAENRARRARGEVPGPTRSRGRAPATTISGNRATATASPTQTAVNERPASGGTTTVTSRRSVTVNGLVSETQLRPLIENVLQQASAADAASALENVAETGG